MWSSIDSLVSIKEWAEVVKFNPYLLAQIGEPANTLFPRLGSCERAMIQSGWQGGGEYLSRDTIADALRQAEDIIAEHIGSFVAPREWYDTLAEDTYPRNYDYTKLRSILTAVGEFKPFELQWGNVVAMGRYTQALIEADVAVVESDPYGNGYNTRFTVTVTVPSGTLASEIKVYYNTRYDLDLSDCEIRSLDISVDGTTATIKGYLYQIVDLANYLRDVPVDLVVTDAIYETSVDVYRQTVDESQSGYLIWESDDCADPPCEQVLGTACFRLVNRRQGWVRPVPAIYDTDNSEFDYAYINRAPDRVRCNYIAGVPREADGRVAKPWRDAVAFLATALIPNKSCGCSRADQVFAYYRSDYTEQENGIGNSPEMIAKASEAFGTTGRGAVRAYAIIHHNTSSRVFESANG